MTQGVLIFAFNNEQLDYLAQACWIADRVERYLNKPVTIVTDKESVNGRDIIHSSNGTRGVIFADREAMCSRQLDRSTEQRSRWYNTTRYQAYDLSPYDETIVIDSDYIVSSDQLNLLYESQCDFLTHRTVLDVTDQNSFDGLQTFGQTQMPHYWATVLFFRKGEFANAVFTLVQMIKDNWSYYSSLYKFTSGLYRNDYAVSLAQLIVYGHRMNAVPTIPWELVTAGMEVDAKQLDDETFELHYKKYHRTKERPMRSIISGQDWHCLNKVTLEDMINANPS